jgi:phospholipid/cholesterol/gamma-HCH transport system substrate-binding protein
METKANYVITGLFTLAVIVGAFGFVYWFQSTGGGGERATYRVVFEGSVSGLRTGASVLFNGIRVGEVAELTLDPRAPRSVIAIVSVDRNAPVRADTKVALEFQGLTGLASLALTGGSADRADITGAIGDTPLTLKADAGATADVTQAARETLRRIDSLVADNEMALRASLRNIETVTATLAQNSDRFEKVMAGLETLSGGEDGKSGQIGEAAAAIRKLAENLDKRSGEISTGLARFSNSGLKEFEAFAIDGRRTLAELQKAIKNIDKNPTRLIWGR